MKSPRTWLRLLLAIAMMFLSACNNIQRLAHSFSGSAPWPVVFHYRDGGESLYYSFSVGEGDTGDTWIFHYGASGCASWKYVMPGYLDGLSRPAKVYALNKRTVHDRGTGMLRCGREFYLHNNPGQWSSDYVEFSKVGKKNLAFRVYPGANHLLSAGGVAYRAVFFRELGRLIGP